MIWSYFDELKIGEKFTTRGRTMTETDMILFCMLTGNWLELHSNIEYAKTTQFGQRLIQGSLSFSIIAGLVPTGTPGRILAFYGVDRLRFIKPVFIGDTLHAETEIIDLQDKNETSGVSTHQVTLVNQHGETVQSSIWKHLVAKKPKGARSND